MTQTAPRPNVTEIPEGLSNARVARKGNLFDSFANPNRFKL